MNPNPSGIEKQLLDVLAGWEEHAPQAQFEPVSERRTGLGRVAGSNTMNESKPTPTETKPGAPRNRRTYDAAFKQSAIAHCQRHGGDMGRTAQELGLNHWTLRDLVQEDRRKQQGGCCFTAYPDQAQAGLRVTKRARPIGRAL